jgi:hypothetical protein
VAVIACQGIFCIEKQGLATRLGMGDGAAAALFYLITFAHSQKKAATKNIFAIS